MTQDDAMTPNIPYTINKAYMALRDNGIKADLDWMMQLRLITETQLATYAENASLRRERHLCLRTVKQLQETIDTLRMTNDRYGKKIYDMDKAINDAMSLLEDIPEDYSNEANIIDEAHTILDKALTDFPRDLIREGDD